MKKSRFTGSQIIDALSQLVVDALMMAVWRRGRPQELLYPSDQGSRTLPASAD